MKKLWKFIKWSFITILSLLLLIVVVLAFTGIPNLGSAVSKNVPRVSWSNMLATMNALDNIQC